MQPEEGNKIGKSLPLAIPVTLLPSEEGKVLVVMKQLEGMSHFHECPP